MHANPNTQTDLSSPLDSASPPNSSSQKPPIPPPPPTCSPLITRSKTNSSRLKPFTHDQIPYPNSRHCLTLTINVPNEPSSYTLAARFSKWRDALSREFQALLQSKTWSLVPPPLFSNIIGYRCVF